MGKLLLAAAFVFAVSAPLALAQNVMPPTHHKHARHAPAPLDILPPPRPAMPDDEQYNDQGDSDQDQDGNQNQGGYQQ